ncbi:DUF4168 domain-containing protein [uncultured Pigmentiphaga sp.]|jgi:hypothetical protein|uniref:DUF4168 domain-containing protein n=1 Tax=uncultured Pigmentiphaga sp. TaxID=340361 RepID=UPI002626AC2B|nr:DUF4168 domain-containing protein [uncultured Pigmentiphaga sp.]
MNATIKSIVSAAALAAGLAACGTPQRDVAPSPQASATPQSVTPDQLQRFANAAKKVNAISPQASGGAATSGASSGMSAASGQATLATFDESNGRKAQAIWSEGLTVQEFNSINAAIQQDPALMQRYGELMQGGSAGGMGSPSGGGTMMR